ncbi:MAG: FAD-dependent oxidoreductase [Chloroflexi bacterium]|nr:FAD-dependent oxidoreductase [Chloroflexota bacterium]
MLDWLIVGGGAHGTAISHYLTARCGVPRDQLRVLDPHDRPLALWHQFTANTGMAYLRSPLAHHLHDDVGSLKTFALTADGADHARFIPKFNRPSLALFNAHCEWMLRRYDLEALRIGGRAGGLTRLTDGWAVTTDSGEIESRRVLLALGATEQPLWPEWACDLRASGAPIDHIFAPEFVTDRLPPSEHTVVIGGGITAVQTALLLAARQPGTITLLRRHGVQIADFDSDPCWSGPLCLNDFCAEPDPNRRRAIIDQARHRGSLPPDVADALESARRAGTLKTQQGEVIAAAAGDMGIALHLTDCVVPIRADRVVLATGFASARPGGAWLDRAIADHDLPAAACGYPIVDAGLCWAPGLYVTGPLAELAIGPASRNLIGARLAARRIGAHITQTPGNR